jgi:D-3-phosphoglycerate dehydrogenase
LHHAAVSARENLAILREQFDVSELNTPEEDTDDSLENAELWFAPLGYVFAATKMVRCPRLKAIATSTTGDPHVNKDAAAKRSIAVFSLKDEQSFLDRITPTAEHTWGLLLALIRRTPWARPMRLPGKGSGIAVHSAANACCRA